MVVYIPSCGRAKTITTHKLLNGWDYYVVVHNDADAKEYAEADNGLPPSKIIASNQPYGISLQRQWIKDNLAEGWYVMMDDNIKEFWKVKEPEYQQEALDVKDGGGSAKWRPIYNNPIDSNALRLVFEELKSKALEIGAYYGGFATVENFFFRAKKWQRVAYVISKAALYLKDKIEYDPKVLAMDDYAYTAENLLKHGTIINNKYIFPVAGHYESGGIGKYEERVQKKIKDCKYLINKYPKLFRYFKKKSAHPEAELMIRFHSTKQVEKWRTETMGNNNLTLF